MMGIYTSSDTEIKMVVIKCAISQLRLFSSTENSGYKYPTLMLHPASTTLVLPFNHYTLVDFNSLSRFTEYNLQVNDEFFSTFLTPDCTEIQ